MEKWQIVRIRKMLDISQQQMAELLDISISTYARYEKGYASPTPTVSELLQVLKTTSENHSRARTVNALIRSNNPRLGVLWYVLDPVFRERFRE